MKIGSRSKRGVGVRLVMVDGLPVVDLESPLDATTVREWMDASTPPTKVDVVKVTKHEVVLQIVGGTGPHTLLEGDTLAVALNRIWNWAEPERSPEHES